MATEEHMQLSSFIKSVHSALRESSKEKGFHQAWEDHKNKQETLKTYSRAMKKLAGMWEENASNNVGKRQICKSRVAWINDFCSSYFFTIKLYEIFRAKELNLVNKCNIEDFVDTSEYLENVSKINLLDVGSCFNPFKKFDCFDVTAIDLCPENDVYKGDFLQINIANEIVIENGEVISLQKQYFKCIVFSLMLEYLPTSEQRLLCIQKAYDLLKFEGILIIITPDSQHVGKNAKLMKNWRYTLALLGFSRIKFEKLSHITCMAFRKSISSKLCERWANIHKEEYMTMSFEIPQDT